MVESWLALLLLRPLPSIPRQTEAPIAPKDGAVLALGGVPEYQHIRLSHPRTELPAHDEHLATGDDERLLLVALLNVLLGHSERAVDLCRAVLATSDDNDLLAAAGVLASVALSEIDEPDVAQELVRSTIDRLPASAALERAALLVHRSARLADLGRWDAAHAAANEATALEAIDELSDVVLRAASANERLLRGRATGTWLFDDSPIDPLPRTLRWRLEHFVAAGDEALEASFRDALQSPLGSEWHHIRQSVDRQLWSLVFHTQCRAQISQTQAALSSLGRHRVLAALIADSSPGFDTYKTLLDAGDAELDRVLRHFVQRGPVEGLAELAKVAAGRPWEQVDTKAVLDALAVLGQLLDVELADSLAYRLLAFIEEERAWNLREPGSRALAATLSAASHETHAATADRLLGWFDDPHSERWLDVLARTIRWPDVPRELQRRARGLVQRWALGEVPESTSALLLPLSRGRTSRWGQAQASRAFQLRPNLQNSAFVLDVGTPSPAPVLQQVRALALEAVATESAEADRGHYGFGGINAALVLVVALIRIGRPDPESWSVLAGYLADPKTLARNKEDVVDAIAHSVEDLDGDAVEVIQGALRSGVAGQEFFGGETSRELDSAVAGLSMSLGLMDGALVLLRRQIGSTSVADRIAGARMLTLARAHLDGVKLRELTLVLLWDADPNVRAAAARGAIDLLRRTREVHVEAELADRLVSMLREEGTTAPLAVLRHLPALSKRRRARFVDPVLDASVRAPSALVRGAASHVARRWGTGEAAV